MSTTLLTPTDSAPTPRLPQPTTVRWRPLRAGLQNIWQYDHTTRFVFHDGRLLLRGRNGVGKTKVVEVLLPFLLEGSMQPARLDPFGSRSRRMHFNLLHDGNADQQSAVAYVWLEFGRLDGDGTPQYATIGAGLKARRSSDQVESWFFATALRVDEQLHLVDDTRTPLSRPALEELLGEAGEVLATAREYRTAVNRLLFDVPAPQYEAMVDALLRLRQPHLSERLEPNELDTVLSDSLPPLDEDRLREVAEGFDRLEAHRTELADRRRSLRAVEDFLAIYTEYAAVVAAVRGRAVTSADYGVRSAAEQVAVATSERGAAEAERDRLDARSREVADELRAADERLTTLRQSDSYRAVQDLERAENEHTAAERRATEAADRRDATRDELDVVAGRVADADRRLADRADADAAAERDARAAAGEADLVDEHAGVVGGVGGLARRADLTGDKIDVALRTAGGAAAAVGGERRAAIARVRTAQDRLAAAELDVGRAQATREDADATVRDAAAALNDAEDGVTGALDAFADGVRAWTEDAVTVAPGPAVVAALLDSDPERAAVVARDAAAPRRDELDAAVGSARAAQDGLDQQLDATRAERVEVAAAAHQPPAAPAWRNADRAGRAGAPFYMLVEFTDALPPHERANVEAALDALGLLDAWVLPDGTVLGGDEHDAVLVEGDGAPGRTLADVARPVPTSGMWDDTVPSILGRIALRAPEAVAAVAEDRWDDDVEDWLPDGGTAYVSTAGHFAMGLVDGRTEGTEVRYLGAAARERARQRRLAELDDQLVGLDRQRAEAADRLDDARERRRTLDAELDAFPNDGAVVEARAVARVEGRRLQDANDHLAAADRALAAAVGVRDDAVDARDLVALETGLVAHAGRLDALTDATRAWEAATATWLAAAARWLDQRRHHAEVAARHQQVAERAARDEQAAERARSDLGMIAARIATLSEMVGADRDDIRARVRAAGDDRQRLDGERDRLDRRKGPVYERLGAADAALGHAREEQEQAEAERAAATAAFVALVDLGVLDVLPVTVDGDPHRWGVRAALDRAREVVAAGPDLPDDPEAVQARLERAENRLAGGQQQLQREAVGDIRPMLRREHGVAIPEVRYAGRLQRLGAVAEGLRDDVAERDRRLASDEQGLLETFLTGELHEHLRGRIRDARALVDTMNERLADCATTAGHRVRLRWEVAEDATPGTAEAIELLLRGRSLVTDDQRDDLRAFLTERLRGAREGDAAASLQERIGSAFDHRRWHQFTVEFRADEGGAWKRLTRQSHGAGSGGEKAVMLHLPLFAAMAAHYEAAPSAPRLIVLDEVFAGIDRETRGQLMGLLVELDLDALLTSHDEWGFYAELDGLSTYHLVRDPAMAGVLAEWFVWDGATRWEMGS